MIGWFEGIFKRFAAWWRGDLKVVQKDGDTLPALIQHGRLIHMVDAGESWSVGFYCPCGCGDVIELLLLTAADPHWTLSVDASGRPTLRPSVWRTTGCKSHFWIRNGQTVWAEPKPRR